MINKDKTWSEGSIPYAKKDDEAHFSKMYPETDMNGKYILWLELGFYWHYCYKAITPKLIVEFKNGEHLEMPKIVARQLMPNKSWSYACMKNGRRLSDKGVILHFDSFEEISQINRICCCWDIEYEDGKHFRAFVNYKVEFENEPDKFNYSITSHDTDLATITKAIDSNNSVFSNKTDEYNKMFILKQIPNMDAAEIVVLKGDVDNADVLEGLVSTFGLGDLVELMDNDEPFRIECFSTEEVIAPLECSLN